MIDDSNEDYLYSIVSPCSIENPDLYGEWEIAEDPTGLLKDYIKT